MGSDTEEEFEDEVDEVVEESTIEDAFLQLQHNYELLRKEKLTVEQHYEEAMTEADQKEEAIQTLKKRNGSLYALARHLGKVSETKTADLENLAAKVEEASIGKGVTITHGSHHFNQEESNILSEARRLLEKHPLERGTGYNDVLESLEIQLQNAKQELEEMQATLKAKDRMLQRVSDNYDEARAENNELRSKMRGRPSSELLEPPSPLHLDAPISPRGGRSPSPLDPKGSSEGQQIFFGENHNVKPITLSSADKNGREGGGSILISYPVTAVDFEAIRQEIETLQTEQMVVEQEKIGLRDQLDEALTNLVTARKKLEAKYASDSDEEYEYEEGYSLEDEIGTTKRFKGLRLQEQKQIMKERTEFKLKAHEFEEELVMLKQSLAEQQWKKEKAITYSNNRDKEILHILKKPLKKKTRLRLIEILRKTALNF